MDQLRNLGATGISVTPVGLGCWQFSEGKALTGSYWPTLGAETTNAIVAAALSGGINWFDTAEAYGWGASEAALSRALREAGRKPGEVVIADKWFPILRSASSIRRTIDKRLAYLDNFPIDLHQIHAPYGSFSSHRRQLDAMGELIEAGKIKAVGVSNFNARQLRSAHERLARRGIPLAANQVQYNLLQRDIEHNGVLQAARELGISIIAYSPLAQGLLTGKYHREPELIKSKVGPRKRLAAFGAKGLSKSAPVIDRLRAIAGNHGKTPAQVALRWLVQAQGDTVVAIPGATRIRHAAESAGVLDFTLTESEVEQLRKG